jgi:cobalt-zinc-cadmium resistance protein CzcA
MSQSIVQSLTVRIVCLCPLLLPFIVQSQESGHLQQLIDLALANNKQLKVQQLIVDQSESSEDASADIDKTTFYFNKDQNNLPPLGGPLSVWGVQQKIQFPTVYAQQKKARTGESQMHVQENELEKMLIAREVCRQYYALLYYQQLDSVFQSLDSLYRTLETRTRKQLPAGKTSSLEQLTAAAKWQEIVQQRRETERAVASTYASLQLVVQAEIPFSLEHLPADLVTEKPLDLESHPGILYFREATKNSNVQTKLEQNKLFPDIQLEYFVGRNGMPSAPVYSGLQVGLAVPLFYGAQKANIESAQIQEELVREQAANYVFSLYTRRDKLRIESRYYLDALTYYTQSGRQIAAETRILAWESYLQNKIDFFQYVQTLENTKATDLNYLHNLCAYNETQIELNYLQWEK